MSLLWTQAETQSAALKLFDSERSLTIEAIDGLLPQATRDPPVDPLVLVALVLQEVLKQVEHLCHLGEKTADRTEGLF